MTDSQNPPTNQAVAITTPVADTPAAYFEAVTPAALDSSSILAANRDACLAAMAHIGAQFASVEYAGSGDSGDGFEVFVSADVDRRQRLAKPLLRSKVGMLFALQRWEEGNPFGRLVVYGTELKRMALQEALESLCDQAIDHFGHAGFENNDGGRGVMSLSSSEGLTLEHSDYYTDSNDYIHTLAGAEGVPEGPAEAVAA
jgi:hypothetical protein